MKTVKLKQMRKRELKGKVTYPVILPKRDSIPNPYLITNMRIEEMKTTRNALPGTGLRDKRTHRSIPLFHAFFFGKTRNKTDSN